MVDVVYIVAAHNHTAAHNLDIAHSHLVAAFELDLVVDADHVPMVALFVAC